MEEPLFFTVLSISWQWSVEGILEMLFVLIFTDPALHRPYFLPFHCHLHSLHP